MRDMGGSIIFVLDVVFERLLNGLIIKAVLNGANAVEFVLLEGTQLF